MALHLEDIGKVRIQLQCELDRDRSLGKSLQMQVVVQRAVHTSSEREQQRAGSDLARRITQRPILILPLRGAMPEMRTPE